MRAIAPKAQDIQITPLPIGRAIPMLEVQAKFDELKAYDPATAEHCIELSALAVQIALTLNTPEIQFSKSELEQLQVGALLHDLGKVQIPLSVLHKETDLTNSEWDQIRQHPQAGHELLGPELSSFETIAACVLLHHERLDGTGYPHGLKGDQIPIAAQIIGIVDTYDAMVCERPNNPALTTEEALEKLSQMANNGIVNPLIVDALYELLDQRRERAA